MEKIKLKIAGIPAVLYGKRSRKVYLYVHGKTAAQRGCPLCPHSLPGRLAGSGCRSAGARHPKKQPGKAGAVGGYPGVASGLRPDAAGMEADSCVRGQHRCVVCHAALQTQTPEKALLVSPVVDMEKLILDLMQQAGVTEEQLHAAGEIPTAMGETLSWPYLCWVREHPLHWKVPTQVLYADTDPLPGTPPWSSSGSRPGRT